MTAEGQKRRRADVARVRAERDRLHEVGRRTYRARRDDGNVVAYPLFAKARIHARERKFDGNAHIVADTGGRGARAAAEPVDGDDVRPAPRDAAGDRRAVVHRRDLHDDGLFVTRRLFQRIDELAEVFDRIDVVMRRGRNGVHPLRDHAGGGNGVGDLAAGQVPADARLRALPHLDLDRSRGLEIVFKYPEPARRDLHDGVLSVFIEIFMQAAFARVVIDAEFFRRPRERFVRVVGDRAVTHGGEHDGNAQFELRGQGVFEFPIFVAFEFRRLFAEVHRRFHRLAQRVDGRVCYLRRVDEHFVPIHGVRLGRAHGREQNAARASLAVHFVDGLVVPVPVDLRGVVRLYDF